MWWSCIDVLQAFGLGSIPRGATICHQIKKDPPNLILVDDKYRNYFYEIEKIPTIKSRLLDFLTRFCPALQEYPISDLFVDDIKEKE